uniref:DUF1540 domain-containing protein n=1 Tax=Caenorhabditis tropicalis TaxID=1561998 RepID=A0A1I7TRX0_9PELO
MFQVITDCCHFNCADNTCHRSNSKIIQQKNNAKKENQLISRENEKCVQYDYVYFEWINTGIPNPFPDVIDGREYCTAVSCEDVFGPEESVDCSLVF